MVYFRDPRLRRNTEHSLGPGSFHSLCAPGHVTKLPSLDVHCWEIVVGPPPVVGRDKVQDIQACLTQSALKLGSSLPALALCLQPCVKSWVHKIKRSPFLPSSRSAV